MSSHHRKTRMAMAVLAAVLATTFLPSCAQPTTESPSTQVVDPLPSWNGGNAKQAILGFVERVTDPANPDFVAEPERIATFDKAGKPVGINSHIGRRPIAAFGNSDGDFQMLEWSTSAADRGWIVTSMKNDWKRVSPWEDSTE